MKLFISNLTKGKFEFHWREPENPKLLTLDIAAGSQIMLPNDYPRDVIDLILAQHEEYGMIPASEVYGKANQGIKTPLAYSIDKPVDLDRIANGVTDNDTKAQQVAEEAMKNAAAAGIKGVEDATGQEVNAMSIETFAETTEAGIKKATKIATVAKG